MNQPKLLSERILQTVRAFDVRLELVEQVKVSWPHAKPKEIKDRAITLWFDTSWSDHLVNLYAKGIYEVLGALEQAPQSTHQQSLTEPQQQQLTDLRRRAQEIAEEWLVRAKDEKDLIKQAEGVTADLKTLAANVRLSEKLWSEGMMHEEKPLKAPAPAGTIVL